MTVLVSYLDGTASTGARPLTRMSDLRTHTDCPSWPADVRCDVVSVHAVRLLRRIRIPRNGGVFRRPSRAARRLDDLPGRPRLGKLVRRLRGLLPLDRSSVAMSISSAPRSTLASSRATG
jgi:hypothetical protein